MGQSISTTQFYLFGKRHCTVTGYTRHKLAKDYGPVQTSATVAVGADGADGFDLSGKVVMITGANSGIGKELATYAATKKAKVYMLCRNAERAEKARQDIIQKSGADDTSVKTLLADVGVLSQVREVVSDFQSMESKVDCLVCNAGVLLNDRQVTSEGNEVTFASHLLGGSYLLSTLLLPQLKAAGDEARVVFVSSGGMYNTKFPEWAVLSNAKKYLEPMRSIWEGAEGICWLMSTARSNLESGSFYLDRKPQRKHISGPFMTDGSFTKNSEAEVDAFMG